MRSVTIRCRALARGATLLVACAAPALAQESFSPQLYPGGIAFGGATIHPFELADFDGDGELDLAGTTPTGIALAPGRGDGTFDAAIASAPGGAIGGIWMESADLDGDGALDLVGSAGWTASAMSVARGLGDGTFGHLLAFPLTNNPCESAELADLDLDGELDLLVATDGGASPKYTSVLLGAGDGAFVVGTPVASGKAPSDVAVADFDLDGIPDFAVVEHWQPGNVRLFRGQGAATFAASSVLPAGLAPNWIATGDWNSDGWPDLATISSNQKDLTTHVNGGAGGFVGAVTWLVGMHNATELEVVDLDRDGALDFVFSDSESGPAWIEGRGDGSFTAVTRYLGNSYTLELGDLNGDDVLDVVWPTAPFFASTLGVAVGLGLPEGGFDLPVRVALPSGSGQASYLVQAPFPADYDGDGLLDVAGAERGLTTVYRGDGAGGLAAIAGPSLAQGATLCARGDVDADGDVDLVITTTTGVRPLVNDGAAQFAPTTAILVGAGVTPGVLEDLNGDGDLDLAVAAKDSYQIAIALGAGAATFASPSILQQGAPFRVLRAGDLDGDGALDLVAGVGLQFEGLHLFPGLGNGSFAPSTLVPEPFVHDVALLDLDEDGDVDVATGGPQAKFLPGDGAGGLGAAQLLVLGPSPSGLEFADLDADGHVDLAAHSVAKVTPLHKGSGSLPLAEPTYVSGGGVPRAADFDGDGRVDLALLGRDYVFSPNTSPHVAVLVNKAVAPALVSIDGLVASAAGQVIVHGAGFEALSTVSIDGAFVPVAYVDAGQLAVTLAPSEPGWFDVVVNGTFGSASLAAGLARWPALSAGPGHVGAPLALVLENGGAGLYALAVSGALLPSPIPIVGIHHGIELASPLLFAVGSIAIPQTAATVLVDVPQDPTLIGVGVYLQGWAQAPLPTLPASSFSNAVLVILQ